MSRQIRQLETWVLDRPAGLLSRADASACTFTYLPQARDDVALTMPRQMPTFSTPTIPPPFDQQVPEMDLRLFSPAIWKELRPDEFGMLLIAGNRRLGRMSFAEPGADRRESAGLRLGAKDLDAIDDGDAFLLATLAKLEFVPGISGVQPKTLASIGDLVPARAAVDTHIVKGNRVGYEWATVVEALSLRAAAAAGLATPAHRLSLDGRLLAVERFDLRDGRPLGFDEACALTGRLAKDKYAGSYESMCATLLQFVPPARRLETAAALLRQLALCYAIENGDAHLKNFGLVYDDPGDAALSPAYDVLTTTCFADTEHDIPALTLDGRKVWDAFDALERVFTRRFLLPRTVVVKVFEDVLAGIAAASPEFDDYSARYPLSAPTLQRTAAAWRRGADRLATHLAGRRKPR